MSHLTYTTLLSYIGNQLPKADRAKIEEHLFSHPCPQCGNKLARLRTVLDAVTGDRSVAPPSAVLRRAFDVYQKRPVTSPQPLLQVLAILRFDSRLQLSPMLSRGATKTRQMLFTAQQVDIDLQITPEHGDHNLIGQILGSEQASELPPAFVSLKNDAGQVLKGTETDLLGQFTFRQIPSGIYNLEFELDSQEVAITGLELINDQ